MNAKELSEKLQKMAKEYGDKGEDKKLDYIDRSYNNGLAMGFIMAKKELLENILKGDIR